jgi:hypothetical protein
METPPLLTKRRIKSISPLQLGKMLAILYGFMGLIFIPFFLIMSFVASLMPAPQCSGMMAFGIGFTLFMPVISAAFGFIFGALTAWIYNVVAKWVGGIEVEVG